jgi:hypothetical protein
MAKTRLMDERRSGAHMCRDDHIQIWHNDGEHEQCPLCLANYEIERLNDLLAASERLRDHATKELGKDSLLVEKFRALLVTGLALYSGVARSHDEINWRCEVRDAIGNQ